VTSPKSAARSNWYGEKRDPDMADLPKLRRLSDVLWGFWFRDNPDIKNIRYFFMIGISNDLTNQLIVSALKNAKKKLTEWPGARYSTETDEGKALLGRCHRYICMPIVDNRNRFTQWCCFRILSYAAQV
jgi:hypothetical protein